ncbi:MAG TPA: hypothetical protein PLV92_13310, partial [Pirellulaceae bacterium]|nr:hypothetical protein [Pirellulaceae bacterium]
DNDGAVTVTGLGTISFTQLEPVDLQSFATVNVQFANANDVVNLTNGFDASTGLAAALVVSGTSATVPFETVHLRNNSTVVIDTVTGGADGNDTVTVVSGDNAHGNTNLTITTGAGTDTTTTSGALTLTGDLSITSPAILINSAVTISGSATLAGTSSVTVQAAGIDASSGTGDIDISTSAGNILLTGSGLETAGGGEITIDANGGTSTITINGPLTSAAGNITLTADDDISIGATAISSTSGDVSATADADSSGAVGGALTMNATASIDAGSGTITLTAAENVAVAALFTTNSSSTAVSLTSNFVAVTDANAAGVNITANSGGFFATAATGVDLDTTVDFAAATITSSGNITVDESNGLDGLNLNAGAGNVTLNVTTGNVNDSDAGVDIAAAGLTVVVTAGSFGTTSFAAGFAIETNVGTISVNTSGAGGSQFIRESNGWTALSLNAGAGNVLFRSNTGNVTDADGSIDVIAASFGAQLGSGNLGAAGPVFIQTTVANFEAQSTGSIWVSETNDLTIGGATGSLSGLTSSGGNITIQASGDLTQSETISSAAGGGSISLSAAGNATFPAGQLVNAGTVGNYGPVTVNFDTDASGGATVSFAADVDASTLTINGQSQSDQFDVTPDQDTGSRLTPITLNGAAPTTVPGDSLLLDITGLGTPTLVIQSGQNNGQFQFAGLAANVNYNSIEFVDTTPAASCYNLLLDMTLAGYLDASADTIDVETLTGDTELRLSVNGPQVYRGNVTVICQLSIVGSSDDDTIDYSTNITGPLAVSLTDYGTSDGFEGSLSLSVSGPDLSHLFDNIDSLVGSSSTGSTPATGDELIQAMSVNTTWNVTSDDGGDVNVTGPTRTMSFTGFENLTGSNAGTDTFVLSDGMGLTGQLDGRGPTGAAS